ncbi:MAG: hypothetical protein PF541_08640 [Prolixibacteraceae bacterium]|jgi:hypothetical protein|nr:hypothetical protein [Prolixibacteraceae bacterium]
MKKLAIISTLILISVGLFSQNWNLYPKGQESTFKYDIGTKTIINKFVLDSSSYENRMVYFYNDTILKKFNFEDTFYNTRYSLKHFLYEEVNQEGLFAYYDWTGETMNFYQYDLEYEMIYKAYEFKPFALKGESWETGLKTITCTEMYIGNVLGVSDSLKKFSVKYQNGSLSEIILSKTYGLVKFVPLDRLAWNNEEMPTNCYYELIGYTNTKEKEGY